MADYEERRSPGMNLCVQVSMRVLAIATAIASTWLMITNRQVASVYGISFEAKYSYDSTFRYYVYAEIAVCAGTLFTLLWSFFAVRKGGNVFALFIFDLLVTMTAISAFSAATAEGFIGKFGNTHAGWLPICRYVPVYCRRVTLSLALSFAAFIILFLLTVLSAAASRRP